MKSPGPSIRYRVPRGRLRLRIDLIVVAVLLYGCSETSQMESVSVDMSRDEVCSLDGMLLNVHDGPKAQLQRVNGERAYFCDTKEIFGELLDPQRRRRVVGIWFQALDEPSRKFSTEVFWQARTDGWVAAQSLYFVVGSARMGAMGPMLAPFQERESAEIFIAAYGGRIYAFDEIDMTLIAQMQQQGMAQFD